MAAMMAGTSRRRPMNRVTSGGRLSLFWPIVSAATVPLVSCGPTFGGSRRSSAGYRGIVQRNRKDWVYLPSNSNGRYTQYRLNFWNMNLKPRPGLGEDRAEDLLDLVEVLLGADQRRGELDHRVAAVVGPADQPRVEQRVRQVPAQQPLGLVFVEGLLGRLVLDQLDPVEVAGPADVADDGQVGQLVQGGPEPVLVLPYVAEEVVPLEHVQVGQRDRGRDRVARERDAVQEGRGPVGERLHQLVADDHPAERRVPGGDALGEGDDVRLVVVPGRAEVVAEPAERADHLVRYQQHAVPGADLPHPLEVAGRRGGAAAGVLHRLEVHRRDRLGVLAQDRPLDLVGRPDAELLVRPPGREVGGTVDVGVRHPDAAGRQRLEVMLDGGEAGDGET